MVRPVAHYLTSFEAQEPPRCDREPPSPPLPAALPIEDQEAMLRAAREAGYADGMVAADAEHSAALEREKLAFEARLASERATWAREEGERLSEKIKGAVAGLEAHIAAATARILQGFLSDALRRQAIDALGEAIGTLLGDKTLTTIEIRGPKDLLDELQRLAALPLAVEWQSATTVDVRVIVGQTNIETRLEAWLERLKSLPE